MTLHHALHLMIVVIFLIRIVVVVIDLMDHRIVIELMIVECLTK